jgi:hypothetical protein
MRNKERHVVTEISHNQKICKNALYLNIVLFHIENRVHNIFTEGKYSE